jgi:uncharacterized membrane protein
MGQQLAHESVRPRLDAIDLLRGLVMVLMALDHTRDFLTDVRFDPLDLSRTNAALFFTRWVTHFCAPVFVFLAGTGAFLYGRRGKTRPELAWFLFSRGLWLVLLEFTLVHGGWSFDADRHLLIAQVLWAIGCSMVALAALVFLPTGVIAALGVALIAGHNLLDGVNPQRLGPFAPVWQILLNVGFVELSPGVRLLVAYPVLPWLGIMMAGYGFGAVWLLDAQQRRRWLLGLGTGLTLLFIVLRTANGYGDPRPWSPQPSALFTLLSFLDCLKYPPSLLYVLMTLGPAILLLAAVDGTQSRLGRVLITFGRVPLFFYLLHVPLIHVLAIGLACARYGKADFLFEHVFTAGPKLPEDYGYGLPAVYLAWLGVVLLLYPPCRWFAGLKTRSRAAWLSYL